MNSLLSTIFWQYSITHEGKKGILWVGWIAFLLNWNSKVMFPIIKCILSLRNIQKQVVGRIWPMDPGLELFSKCLAIDKYTLETQNFTDTGPSHRKYPDHNQGNRGQNGQDSGLWL